MYRVSAHGVVSLVRLPVSGRSANLGGIVLRWKCVEGLPDDCIVGWKTAKIFGGGVGAIAVGLQINFFEDHLQKASSVELGI